MWTPHVGKAISTRSSEPSPCSKRCGTQCNCRGSNPPSEDSTRGLRHHPVIFGRPSIVPMAEGLARTPQVRRCAREDVPHSTRPVKIPADTRGNLLVVATLGFFWTFVQ